MHKIQLDEKTPKMFCWAVPRGVPDVLSHAPCPRVVPLLKIKPSSLGSADRLGFRSLCEGLFASVIMAYSAARVRVDLSSRALEFHKIDALLGGGARP